MKLSVAVASTQAPPDAFVVWRGFVAEGQRPEEAEALFIDTAGRILDHAAARNVTLIIEPANRYEINFVNSLDEGAALLAKVGRENIGLMGDVFHMNIEDAQVGDEDFERALAELEGVLV